MSSSLGPASLGQYLGSNEGVTLPLLSISREELPASLPLATISHFGDMYKVAIHRSNHQNNKMVLVILSIPSYQF